MKKWNVQNLMVKNEDVLIDDIEANLMSDISVDSFEEFDNGVVMISGDFYTDLSMKKINRIFEDYSMNLGYTLVGHM